MTDEQAAYLARQFDVVIWPREATVFPVPVRRDGSGNTFPGVSADAFEGEGDNLVARDVDPWPGAVIHLARRRKRLGATPDAKKRAPFDDGPHDHHG